MRVGVAGVAGMGMFHVMSFPKHEGVEVTALCDPWTKALEGAKGAAKDASTYTDFGEMCSSGEVDAVVIATPNSFHAEAVTTALRAGLHVYCEKPLAVTVSECRKIARLEAETKRTVQIGFQHRFQHGYASAKRIVASGEFGPLRRADMRATDWFRPNAYFAKRGWRARWDAAGGGVLMMQAIHQLDSFLWICGTPSSVRAQAWRGRPGAEPPIQVEDDVYATLTFPGGANGMLSASTLDPAGLNRLEITCDRTTLLAEGDSLEQSTWEDATSQMLAHRTDIFNAPEVSGQTVPPSGDAMTFDECVMACEADFVASALAGKPSSIGAVEATRSVEVANAIYLSSLIGEEVALPLDEDIYDEAFAKMCADELVLPYAGGV